MAKKGGETRVTETDRDVLKVVIDGEDYLVPDPEALVEYVRWRGWSPDLINQLQHDVKMLKTLYDLQMEGLIQQIRGAPTERLLKDTERLLRMLVAAEK